MKTAVMILIIVLSTSGGDVLITRGLKQERDISDSGLRGFLLIGRKILANKNFLAGLSLMAVSFTIPATSLSYVLSTLGAKFVLKEKISRLRWTGTLFVCLGIALISLP
jgi:transporter family protein